ncbi:MAG: 2'-deoxycytidine 5'-triphosphate deaminase, partial [Candidatus Puniceispirillaceae bacterium]
EGSRLSQLRLRRGQQNLDDAALTLLQQAHKIVQFDDQTQISIQDGIGLSVNLTPQTDTELIGWRARKHAGLIDVDVVGGQPAARFWEPVTLCDLTKGGLVLNPDEFYILASREFVTVPPDYAAEMRAYDTRVGEFRAHYAGFFDPGFGDDATGALPTRAVLEVRSHDVPFLIEQGQTVCRLVYEPMAAAPNYLYGAEGSGSNYQSQGLKLAKHFHI